MDFDWQNTPAARVCNPGAEEIIGRKIPVLDDGFVYLVDVMGNDAAIAQAARVSYGPGTKTVSEDEALIRYLQAHHHTSPSEMVELKLHVRAPLVVRNQLVRTRTANWNERSYRYSEMDDHSYVPEPERIGGQSKDNKQGTGGALTEMEQYRACSILADVEAYTQDAYLELTELGVSRETARQATTVSRYTEWYFKLDLHNLLHTLHLRLDPHAQFETREYARAVEMIVERCFPVAYAAWVEFVRDARTFSREEVAIIQALWGSDFPLFNGLLDRLSGRQRREFLGKVGFAGAV